MIATTVSLAILLAGIVPSEMAAAVAERMECLDHLVLHLTHGAGMGDLARSPLDRAGWKYVLDEEKGAEHRLTIVRPNALDEFLRDTPEQGCVPVNASMFDGGYVSRHVRPDRDGRTTYSVVEDDVEAGLFRSWAICQVFDLHIKDSRIPQLNLLRLFEEHDVQLVGAVGDVSTYTATVPMPDWGYTMHFEFDLNSRGTPLRFATVLEFERDDIQPVRRVQYVLATEEVNGAELPTEVVVAIHNPNVASHYGLDYIVVNAWEVRDGLTMDDVRIDVDTRNAHIAYHRPDGSTLHRYTDAEGRVVNEIDTFGGPAPVDECPQLKPPSSLRWRMVIPPIAAALGLAVMIAVRFVSRPPAA